MSRGDAVRLHAAPSRSSLSQETTPRVPQLRESDEEPSLETPLCDTAEAPSDREHKINTGEQQAEKATAVAILWGEPSKYTESAETHH